MRTGAFSLAIMAITVAIIGSPDARANGTLFFQERNQYPDGTPFVGQVVDGDGKPVTAVQILIKSNSPVRNFLTMTDVRGRYRYTIPKEIDPRQIEVSIVRTAWRQERAIDLTRKKVSGKPVEVNFTVARGK